MTELEVAGPPKPARLQYRDLKNEDFVNGLNSNCNGTMMPKRVTGEKNDPRFLVSFLVDARGGVVRSNRHAGLHLVIPAGKVCMPTRITCKLIKADKLPNTPVLKEGEALVSRILELGPAGTRFNGSVLIELPHVASLHNNEREVVALYSNDGHTWQEQAAAPQDVVNSILQSASVPADDYSTNKSSLSIVSNYFPCYFVALSRIRQHSKQINSDGGSLKAVVVPDVGSTFPKGSVTRETKVGLQVLPVPSEIIQLVLGKGHEKNVSASPVVTIEPRRRRFHVPINLTIPLPKTVDTNKMKNNTSLRLLYSLSGGANRSQWEDITTSAPMNVYNGIVSFSTTVSARFWLIDCGTPVLTETDAILNTATKVYNEAVAVPIMARFVVYARRHQTTEAQLRILCLTNDLESSTTLECQQNFHEVGHSDYVELTEGKVYCMAVEGNLVPTAASSSQLAIEVRPFRVNRLSFVVQVRDKTLPAFCRISVLPAVKVDRTVEVQQDVSACAIHISLEETRAVHLATHVEPEELEKNIEIAKQQAGLLKESDDVKPDVGVSLRLGDIALALQSDWVPLAEHLGVSEAEVIKIQTDHGSIAEQAIIMMHLWAVKSGRIVTSDLERALKQIGRNDIVDKYIYGIDIDTPGTTAADAHDDLVPAIDSPSGDNPSPSHMFIDPHADRAVEKQSDVEPSAVYQIEEVWDGTQWHKSMKMVPKPTENTEGDAVLEESVKVSILESFQAGAAQDATEEQAETVPVAATEAPETESHAADSLEASPELAVVPESVQDLAASELEPNQVDDHRTASADAEPVVLSLQSESADVYAPHDVDGASSLAAAGEEVAATDAVSQSSLQAAREEIDVNGDSIEINATAAETVASDVVDNLEVTAEKGQQENVTSQDSSKLTAEPTLDNADVAEAENVVEAHGTADVVVDAENVAEAHGVADAE